MATHKLPKIIQDQFDLQYDILNYLVALDEEVTDISPELRENITNLRKLSIKIKDNPDIHNVSELVVPIDQENSIWGQILAELIRQSIDYAVGWLAPGSAVALYNDTDSPILVRTFDQRDNLRLIAYGSWTIDPKSYTTVSARGETSIQADIGGKIFRCTIGGPHAYNGNDVLEYRRGY